MMVSSVPRTAPTDGPPPVQNPEQSCPVPSCTMTVAARILPATIPDPQWVIVTPVAVTVPGTECVKASIAPLVFSMSTLVTTTEPWERMPSEPPETRPGPATKHGAWLPQKTPVSVLTIEWPFKSRLAFLPRLTAPRSQTTDGQSLSKKHEVDGSSRQLPSPEQSRSNCRTACSRSGTRWWQVVLSSAQAGPASASKRPGRQTEQVLWTPSRPLSSRAGVPRVKGRIGSVGKGGANRNVRLDA